MRRAHRGKVSGRRQGQGTAESIKYAAVPHWPSRQVWVARSRDDHATLPGIRTGRQNNGPKVTIRTTGHTRHGSPARHRAGLAAVLRA